MKIPKPSVVDFETMPIEARPHYPPKPVGVSIQLPRERKPKYYAWGHQAGGNNCSKQDGMRAVENAFNEARNGAGLLCHNSSFDIDVAESEGVEPPTALLCHDTMYLLALTDPHAATLQLKPSAERILGLPPDEQDAVRDWLWDQKVIPRNKEDIGEHIWQAPGTIVGPYANGDITRTLGIFQKLYASVVEQGMLPAYQREQRLMPMLRQNEAEGMRVDAPRLVQDVATYEASVAAVEAWLRKKLKAPDLDLDKARDLQDALDKAGAIISWSLTEKGNRSLSKKNMHSDQFADIQIWQALQYRNKLLTCLRTFMRPWARQALVTDGWIHTRWRQVRGSAGGMDGGARSNRLQSSPNFQNIPKPFSEEAQEEGDYAHPAYIPNVITLPKMRRYILPDRKGHVIGRRDISQQEVRILAHAEDGELLAAYRQNPKMDIHKYVQAMLAQVMGFELPRKDVKTMNFGLIYGMGIPSLADKMKRAVDEARAIKRAQMSILGGVGPLEAELKRMGKCGEPIRTWGGRLYYCEEPKLIDGRWRTFEYKLLNYFCQGSAADATKEILCRYYESGYGDARFMLTVHDEFNISAHMKAIHHEMLRLRDIILSLEFDVPMLSDGEIGPNWHDMTDLVEPEYDFSRWGI